jgi:hypothetical protein
MQLPFHRRRAKNHKERRSLGNTQRETETESFDCREPLTFHQQASKMVSTRSLSLSLALTPALLLCEGNVSRGAVSAKKKTADDFCRLLMLARSASITLCQWCSWAETCCIADQFRYNSLPCRFDAMTQPKYACNGWLAGGPRPRWLQKPSRCSKFIHFLCSFLH